MNKKKLLALLMALVMTLTLVPVTAFAEALLPETLPAIPVAGSNKYVTQEELLGLAQELELEDTSGLASVVAAMNFTTTEEDKATTEFYKDWVADFALFFDKEIENNTITPIGQYGSFGVISLSALPKMDSGTPFLIMKQGMNMQISYANDAFSVRDFVQNFYCGIAIDDITAIPENTEATLQLRLYMPTSLFEALASAEMSLESVRDYYADDEDSKAIIDELKTDESGEYAGIPYFVITEDSFLLRPTYVAQIGDDKYGTLADAVAAAQDGATTSTTKTITLLENIELTSPVEINWPRTSSTGLTIDLNGHNITATNCRALWIKTGYVTLKGNGTISSVATEGSSFSKDSSVIRVGSTEATPQPFATLDLGLGVTVSTDHCYGITIFGNNAQNTYGYGQVLTCKGTVTANDRPAISGNGTSTLASTNISINAGATVSATNEYAIYHPQAGTLTVKGTVSGQGGVEMKAGKLSLDASGVITASGTASHPGVNNNGTSTSGYAIALVENNGYKGGATANISKGTINGTIGKIVDNEVDSTKKATLSVSGGSFNSKVPEEYCASDYEPSGADSNGRYTVQVKADSGVASITRGGVTTYYMKVQEAFDAAQNGETVVLEKDYSYDNKNSSSAQLTANKSITLDLNGHTLEHTNGKNALYVKGNNDKIPNLTVTGTGTIKSNATAIAAGAPAVVTLGPDVNVIGNRGVEIGGRRTTFTTAASITGTETGIDTSGIGSDYTTKIINVNGGTINGGQYGIKIGRSSTVNISDGTIIGAEAAIKLTGGDGTKDYEAIKLNVTGGKFSGNLDVTGTPVSIFITGGIFSVEPATQYIATGYQVIDNTDENTSADYHYTVGVIEGAFKEVKDAAEDPVTNTNSDTTFSFATATTEDPNDDVTYAIKTTTTGGQDPQVAYTPVQTDVVTKPAVSENAADASGVTNEDKVAEVKTAVEDSAASRTTKIQAKLDEGNYGDVNLLTTQAAANAITKAAAAYEGEANEIAKVEIQLQTELTSYTLADKGESVVTTALIYQVTPQAVLLDAFGEQLGEAATLTNSDLEAQGLTLKFELPVPDSAVTDSNKVIVTHRSAEYGDSTSLLDVQGEAGNYYVVIETTHFSKFELTPYVVDGTNELISASLTLGGSIDLNFYLKLQDDVTAVRFTFNGATKTVPVTASSYDSANGRYKFSIPVAAKDIYKDVTIELLNANDATQAFCFTGAQNSFANKFTYSVVEYVNYVKEHGSEAEKALAESLGTYGYYANLHLLKETGHTPYNTVSDLYDSSIIDYKTGRTTYGANPKIGSGMTLLLRSETVIAYRFDYNVGESDYSGYKFYFTHSYSYADGGYTNGERYEVTPVHTGNYWYVESKGIPAAYLNENVTFEIVSNDNAEVYRTTYSPMIYGGSMLSKDTTSETLKNTIRAMYDYNQKAIVCFGS